MTAAEPLSAILARQAEADLAILAAALDAIDALQAATDEEDRRFGLWFRGEIHGNSVRAAERKSTTASYRAVDAVSETTKVAPEIGESWGYSTQEPEVRAAIVAAHLRLSLRAVTLRSSTPPPEGAPA